MLLPQGMRKLITLLLFLNCSFLRPAQAFNSYSNLIPESNLSSSTYLLESIAKLDDVIEEIRFKEKTNHYDKVSFTVSTLANLTPASLSLLNHTLKARINVSENFSNFVDSLALTLTALRISTETHESVIHIHREDLKKFLEVLHFVRKYEKSLLEKQNLAKQETQRLTDIDLEKNIMFNRPTYKQIFSECTNSSTDYQYQMYLSTFTASLNDLYMLTALSPTVIKAQIDAKLLSPTLKKYLSQEVLENALIRCFEEQKLSVSVPYPTFIANLKAIDHASHAIAAAGIWAAINSGIKATDLPSFQQLIKFTKSISPPLIRKTLLLSGFVVGIFYAHELKISYDEISDKERAKYSTKEYKDLVISTYITDIEKHIKELNEKIPKETNGKKISALRNELKNWQDMSNDLRKITQE